MKYKKNPKKIGVLEGKLDKNWFQINVYKKRHFIDISAVHSNNVFSLTLLNTVNHCPVNFTIVCHEIEDFGQMKWLHVYVFSEHV